VNRTSLASSAVLPRPPQTGSHAFSAGPLHDFRNFVAAHARSFGLSSARIDDLVLAANEMASNSILHGGGRVLCACGARRHLPL
jgi:anti-sigma regulatory factor (Ser/Thr protein kinase)